MVRTQKRKPVRMVPLNQEYALVKDGHIVGTITWYETPDRSSIEPSAYAPSRSLAALLPHGEELGNQIHQLIEAGQLIPFDKAAKRMKGLYLIHDHRPGRGHTYMIWTGEQNRRQGPTLRARTVYHFMEKADTPRLTRYSDVIALLDAPGAVLIESLQGVAAGKSWTEVFGDGRVLVANIQKIYQER